MEFIEEFFRATLTGGELAPEELSFCVFKQEWKSSPMKYCVMIAREEMDAKGHSRKISVEKLIDPMMDRITSILLEKGEFLKTKVWALYALYVLVETQVDLPRSRIKIPLELGYRLLEVVKFFKTNKCEEALMLLKKLDSQGAIEFRQSARRSEFDSIAAKPIISRSGSLTDFVIDNAEVLVPKPFQESSLELQETFSTANRYLDVVSRLYADSTETLPTLDVSNPISAFIKEVEYRTSSFDLSIAHLPTVLQQMVSAQKLAAQMSAPGLTGEVPHFRVFGEDDETEGNVSRPARKKRKK